MASQTGTLDSLGKRLKSVSDSDALLGIAVLMILSVMLLPLPSVFLDLLLSVNISVGFVILLTAIYNVLSISPWVSLDRLLSREGGQLIFFAAFLIVLMVFMPRLLQAWWGCLPFENNEKVRMLEKFLQDRGFQYRRLLRWPIFEGRMLTAGVMGIVSRYRYILVTDALVEILSMEELKAVLAHEMDHVKHKHFWFSY